MGAAAVTGAAGTLGRRVLRSLSERPELDRVVALDLVEPPGCDLLPAVTPVVADLSEADVGALLAGVDAVVHLAAARGDEHGSRHAAERNLAIAQRVLAGAAAAGVPHVVLVSSAAVYGAWPANPVPLTEAEPARPAPEFGYAVEKAELERLGGEWARAGGAAGRTVAVLRPAPAVADGAASWLARALFAVLPFRSGPVQPPMQFVHLDDLAAAVALAVTARLDGPYNVAPEGWIEAERVRALAGAPPRLPVPLRFATRLAGWTWRMRVGSTPPGLLPYTVHPWVVASDRLRAAGWEPAWSNEEAFVEAHPGTWWSRLSPKRRQELTLGVAGTGLLGAAALLARAGWRRRT